MLTTGCRVTRGRGAGTQRLGSKGDRSGPGPGAGLLPQSVQSHRGLRSHLRERVWAQGVCCGLQGTPGAERQVGQPQQAGHMSAGTLGCSHHRGKAFKGQGRPRAGSISVGPRAKPGSPAQSLSGVTGLAQARRTSVGSGVFCPHIAPVSASTLWLRPSFRPDLAPDLGWCTQAAPTEGAIPPSIRIRPWLGCAAGPAERPPRLPGVCSPCAVSAPPPCPGLVMGLGLKQGSLQGKTKHGPFNPSGFSCLLERVVHPQVPFHFSPLTPGSASPWPSCQPNSVG